jgi:hypothetical protein
VGARAGSRVGVLSALGVSLTFGLVFVALRPERAAAAPPRGAPGAT